MVNKDEKVMQKLAFLSFPLL